MLIKMSAEQKGREQHNCRQHCVVGVHISFKCVVLEAAKARQEGWTAHGETEEGTSGVMHYMGFVLKDCEGVTATYNSPRATASNTSVQSMGCEHKGSVCVLLTPGPQ